MKSLGENPMPENEKLPVIPDDPEQSKRFAETARLLGVDNTETDFKSALDAIISPTHTAKAATTKSRKSLAP